MQRPRPAVAILVSAMMAFLGSAEGQTFGLPDATLLFGDYKQLHVVTPRESYVLSPPSDEPYNRGYFIQPSVTARGDVVAWGFATRWTGRRARFALGLYSLQNKKWQTYGDFARLKAVKVSPSGRKVAMLAAKTEGEPELLILDVATGAIAKGPYQRGMWGILSWAPDEERLLADIDRDGDSPTFGLLDLKAGTVRVVSKGFGAQWSPDGESIAYFSSPKQCALIRPDGTGVRQLMTAGAGRHFVTAGPIWSPDSKQLLLNVSKDNRMLTDVVLLTLADGSATTKSSTGLPVYGWAAITR